MELAPEYDSTTEVSTGTTIMACKFDGGVIIGADSRTSTGQYVWNRVSKKLTPLADKIFCCRSGSAADTQTIAELVRNNMEHISMEQGTLPCVKSAAKLCQHFCYSYRTSLSAGMIVAGYDEVDGPQVYGVPIGGALIPQEFTIGGSGSTFMYAWCDEYFKPNMTKEECLKFVVEGIKHAIHRDGSSGGLIRTMVITKEANESATHVLQYNA